MYASKIHKFAINFGFEVKQQRTIAITNKTVYNIKGTTVQREVKIEDICGMTRCKQPSKNVTEFTIHVENSYDYRYSSDS